MIQRSSVLSVPHNVATFLQIVDSLKGDSLYLYVHSAGPIAKFAEYFNLLDEDGLTKEGRDALEDLPIFESRYRFFMCALKLSKEFPNLEYEDIAMMITCVFLDKDHRPKPVFDYLMELKDARDPLKIMGKHRDVGTYCFLKRLTDDKGNIMPAVLRRLERGVGKWSWDVDYRQWVLRESIPAT